VAAIDFILFFPPWFRFPRQIAQGTQAWEGPRVLGFFLYGFRCGDKKKTKQGRRNFGTRAGWNHFARYGPAKGGGGERG